MWAAAWRTIDRSPTRNLPGYHRPPRIRSRRSLPQGLRHRQRRQAMITAAVALTAIIAITGIEAFALHRGINGKGLAIAIGSIAALGGALTGRAIP